MPPLERFNCRQGRDKTTQSSECPLVTVHGRQWFLLEGGESHDSINKVAFWQWYAVDKFGEKVYSGSAIGFDMSRLDALCLMYPPEQLDLELKLVNEGLQKKKAIGIIR